MRVVRSGDGERAFEEAYRERGEAGALEDVARRSAARGRLEEVEVCLARLRRIGAPGVDDLEAELHAVVRSVRAHPSYGSKRAS